QLLVVPPAFAAGSVDAVSYLGLGHIFTANQTGNLALLGLAIGQGNSLTVMCSLASLSGFLVGVVLAHLIGIPSKRRTPWLDVDTCASARRYPPLLYALG